MSHLGTPVNRSYESKAGQLNPQGMVADRLIRVNPPIYECRCGTCGTVQNISHVRFDNASCSNHLAHGRGEVNRSQTTITISPNTATRSRDAQSAREYQREQEQRTVTYSFTGEPDFAGADPSSIRAWMDAQEENNR